MNEWNFTNNPDLIAANANNPDYQAAFGAEPTKHPALTAVNINDWQAHMETIKASEKDVQQAVIDLLLWSGWGVIRVNCGGMENSNGQYVPFVYWYANGQSASDGVSDLLAFKDGRQVFIEIKAPGKPQRANQIKFMTAVMGVGCEYWLIDDVDQIAPLLEAVAKER